MFSVCSGFLFSVGLGSFECFLSAVVFCFQLDSVVLCVFCLQWFSVFSWTR